MFRLLLIIIAFVFTSATTEGKVKYRGPKTVAYRYYLRDKNGGTCSLERPRKFLSSKSIERRKRQQLPLDSTDLPVPETIIKQFKIKGTKVLGTSRWNNTILVSAGDSTLLSTLAKLPCVKEARMVFCSPDSIDTPVSHQRAHFHMHYNRWDSLRGDPLGMARTQIEMLGGENLHERNLRGKGMTIAVLDGGFQNVDRLLCFARTSIEGTHDFVGINKKELSDDEEEEQFYCGIDHGTRVFSAMAAQADQVITGTAPEADYWLLKCEDPETEMPIEEDYWAMAAEFADSAGVDIINSSLGYNDYDAPFKNYQLNDLDGKTSLISRTASMLAHKGIVLCNSAGNSGMGTWKKITVPADAFDILTVGAIDQRGKNAAFSSVGPTQDGRVKPDVMALGSGTTLISGHGSLVHDMGTSFATPVVCGLVACLWQGLREKTALEIIDLIKRSSSQYNSSNNIYGYGTPNFWKAYLSAIAELQSTSTTSPQQ
jgi:hypothetical protein